MGCLLWNNRVVIPLPGRAIVLNELHEGHPGTSRMKSLARTIVWWPLKPWSRVHCDFAGPFLGHMFLIVIDAHSKWIEAHKMSSITSTVTIRHLRGIFAQHVLPETIVTDNGTSFVS